MYCENFCCGEPCLAATVVSFGFASSHLEESGGFHVCELAYGYRSPDCGRARGHYGSVAQEQAAPSPWPPLVSSEEIQKRKPSATLAAVTPKESGSAKEVNEVRTVATPTTDVKAAKQDTSPCSQQTWPYFTPSCIDRSAPAPSSVQVTNTRPADPSIALRDEEKQATAPGSLKTPKAAPTQAAAPRRRSPHPLQPKRPRQPRRLRRRARIRRPLHPLRHRRLRQRSRPRLKRPLRRKRKRLPARQHLPTTCAGQCTGCLRGRRAPGRAAAATATAAWPTALHPHRTAR